MNPVISIIIPCYNSGAFLPEALDSIKKHPNKKIYEVIIVDDGSSDPTTIQLLDDLKKDDYVIIHQENKGPAAARNAGIRQSKGEYILFLDSDNKIRPPYIDEGIRILSSDQNVGVVYGNAAFFGEKPKNVFKHKKIDLKTLLAENYLDICAVIRRKVWDELGGLDEERDLIGHEDWDFWIRVAQTNWQFRYVNQILFDYRVRQGSLLTQATSDSKLPKMESYFYNKHLKLLVANYKELSSQYLFYSSDRSKPLRSFIKYFKSKYLNKNSR